MKKQLILAFWILTTLHASAQTGSEAPLVSQAPFDYDTYVKRLEEDAHSKTMDKRFLKDSLFRQGELRTRKGLFTTELVYRFDQVLQMVEVKMEDNKQMYLETKDVLYCKIHFEDHTAVFMPVILPKQKKLTLVQVVYKTPTLQLYRDIHKKVYAHCVGCAYTVDNDYQYYLRKNDKAPLKEVDIDEKSFIKVLPEKKNRITSVFKGKHKEDLTVSKVVHIMGELDKYATLQ
jgi:hypothetical protein